MKTLSIALVLLFALSASGQDTQRRIYETEKAFEKAVADKGINNAFVEFLSPVGVMFLPAAVNGREAWSKRPESPAALTWNPIWIDVSANGVLAYSIGNSQFRPKGRDDANIFYGHYISVWLRQPNGQFLAALDTGINHEKLCVEPTVWKSPADSGKGVNPDKITAADSAVGFYQIAAASGPMKAYKSFLADDVILMRDGKQPAFGRKAALDMLDGDLKINFAKRKSFTEAVELAYVHSPYTVTGKDGSEVERGNFVQVWKLRGKKWLIVADVLVPTPMPKNSADL